MKKTNEYTIQKFMDKQQYLGLIEHCFQECEMFSFRVPVYEADVEDIEYENEYKEYTERISYILDALNSFLIRTETSRYYLDQRMQEKSDIYFYSTKSYTLNKYPFDLVDSIYDWQYPCFFEDLAFYKNGKCWLKSIAHENMCFIYDDSLKIECYLNQTLHLQTSKWKARVPQRAMDTKQYHKLLEYCLSNSDIFSVCIPLVEEFKNIQGEDDEYIIEYQQIVESEYSEYLNRIKPALDAFEKNLLYETVEKRTLGIGNKVACKTFYYNTKNIFCDPMYSVENFYDWHYPFFLDNLCFYKNGRCWMQCVSDEGLFFVYKNAKEMKSKFEWFEFLHKQKDFPIPRLPRKIKLVAQ